MHSLAFDLSKEGFMQSIRITQPFIDSAQFYETAFVLLRRVRPLIDIFEFVTAMTKFLQHV